MPRPLARQRREATINPDLAYEDALIERFRPAFVRADAKWLLDEEDEVIEILRETGGDPVWLAQTLNDQADCCVLTWLPENARLSQLQYASFRRYALALMAVAAAVGQRSGGGPWR